MASDVVDCRFFCSEDISVIRQNVHSGTVGRGITRSPHLLNAFGTAVFRAQTAGWPVVILSDVLTIRPYAGFEAWQPEAAESQSLQPGIQRLCDVSAQGDRQASDGLNEEQRRLAAELGRVTGLNRAFAVQYLADNGWKFDAAVARFNELRVRF
ncbi:MAG: hypothetical protein BJ554DRAFT_1336 [Olpidium bornovanus]|uniref:TAP-C domain-containing protein n=1 Tax=Olpidium bornovanus TaxID=278681 RepID=A0A8H8DHH4_9FUNG|nr:MAG: hypothetical protein BJ554DRAFT_1336 [Olpidium bornovanus]